MNPFSEIKEIKTQTSSEIGNTTKAFEKSEGDAEKRRHITTINEGLEGKTYPETDVKYKKHVFKLNGEKVEGVFPQFESQFETRLPKELWNASDVEQFKYCTKKLQQQIERDPEFAKKFSPRQLEQIKAGAPRISGLTWHHTEICGKMQLVSSEIHEKCRHTGGRSVWGGGADRRMIWTLNGIIRLI